MRRRQSHIERAERLGQAVAAPRADQRHDVAALRRHPGDRDLRHRRADIVGDRAQPLDQRKIGIEVAALEARADLPKILVAPVGPSTSAR